MSPCYSGSVPPFTECQCVDPRGRDPGDRGALGDVPRRGTSKETAPRTIDLWRSPVCVNTQSTDPLVTCDP